MSKRKHKKNKGQSVRNSNESGRGFNRRGMLWMAFTAGVVVAGGVAYKFWNAGPGKSFLVKGGETGKILNPARFPDPKVRYTYALAEQHRDLFDKLYCYCLCDREPFDHRSLLSCYVSTHAAG